MNVKKITPLDGKAIVILMHTGMEVLQSFQTPVLGKFNGCLCRFDDTWSATTARHVRKYCGLNRAEYLKLPNVGFEALEYDLTTLKERMLFSISDAGFNRRDKRFTIDGKTYEWVMEDLTNPARICDLCCMKDQDYCREMSCFRPGRAHYYIRSVEE